MAPTNVYAFLLVHWCACGFPSGLVACELVVCELVACELVLCELVVCVLVASGLIVSGSSVEEEEEVVLATSGGFVRVLDLPTTRDRYQTTIQGICSSTIPYRWSRWNHY